MMTRFRPIETKRLFVTLVALLSVSACGCGKANWGRVTGTVTVDGQPVGPGTLVFEPSDEDRANESSSLGYFDATGEYELVSAGKQKGAPAGNYRVIVMSGGPASLAGEESAVAASRDKNAKIPRRYTDYDGGLTATIEPGRQEIDFDLNTSE